MPLGLRRSAQLWNRNIELPYLVGLNAYGKMADGLPPGDGGAIHADCRV